jgi:hypothetical protein
VTSTKTAGTRTLLIGLAAAAVVCGSAAAAVPTFVLRVHARLGPVAGTTAAGRFSGVLARNGPVVPRRATAVPRLGSRWSLTWKLSVPSLGGSPTASLRIRAWKGAAPVTRVLCTQCGTTANGTMTLTTSQALRIAGSKAVVVVRTGSATLRGPLKVSMHVMGATPG